MSEAFRAKLSAATREQRRFKSQHEYTLEEFGLSREYIRQELGPILDHYALSPETPTADPHAYECTEKRERVV